MVSKHWALFIEGDTVKWSFGLNNSQQDELSNPGFSEELEFQKATVNFIQSLQSIGRELYSEGVASIKLENSTNSSLIVNEIFIISLSDQFFFIISDLAVTSRLISTKSIPFEMEQIICAVLVGQGAILYSTLQSEQEKLNFDIDIVYRNILQHLEIDKKHKLEELVDRGRCSLSPLSMTELLLFHYLLRDHLEKIQLSSAYSPWAIMVDKTGLDIPLAWKTLNDPYLIGNFLSVIFNYVNFA